MMNRHELVDAAPPLTAGLLRKHDHTVREAGNARHVLAVAREHQDAIHLLVADVVVPRPSGRELTRQLAEAHPGAKVPYVFGDGDEPMVHHGMLEPGLAFLCKPFPYKPFPSDALARRVREVLDEG